MPTHPTLSPDRNSPAPLPALAALKKAQSALRKAEGRIRAGEANRRTAGTEIARRRSQKTAATRRGRLDAEVARMYADYRSGLSLNQLGRIYGRDRRSVAELFTTRGLAMRPAPKVRRLPNGQIAALVPKTEAEIEALIAAATRFKLPACLRLEWRGWSLERRAEFIARLRARLQPPEQQRPELPFSPNVRPFDYGTPAAWEILRELNRGLPSRAWQCRLFPVSQGVIWRAQLWFWSHKTGYMRGVWKAEDGRPSLHHLLWAETHGRPVPAAHVVRHADGNPNHLLPENLQLWSRNELVRETQARALGARSRERTELLLARSQKKGGAHGLFEALGSR